MKKTICINLDNVIHNMNDGWKSGKMYGKPIPHAKEMINLLIDHGFTIVIFTARSKKDFPMVKEWLKKYGFPVLKVTNRKIPSLAYVDDRAIRFTNWDDIVRYFI